MKAIRNSERQSGQLCGSKQLSSGTGDENYSIFFSVHVRLSSSPCIKYDEDSCKFFFPRRAFVCSAISIPFAQSRPCSPPEMYKTVLEKG